MIKDCFREEKMRKKKEEQQKNVRIKNKSKENIKFKQMSAQHTISELFKRGIENRDGK